MSEQTNYWNPNQPQTAAAEHAQSPSRPPGDATIQWEASEYVHHEKDALWYSVFILVSVALVTGAILLRQWTFAALIVAMAIAALIYARRPPRVLRYQLDAHGIRIGDRYRSFREYRSFGIVGEGPLYVIQLLPLKRFALTETIYFPREQGERIVDRLGSILPMEEMHRDLVDRVISRLRF